MAKECNLKYTRCTKKRSRTREFGVIFLSIGNIIQNTSFSMQYRSVPRTVLFCAVQCRTVPPYNAILYCTVQISTPVQCCSVLYRADQYPRTVLFSSIQCSSVPPYSAVQCGTVQVSVYVQWCSVVNSSTVQCMFSVVQCLYRVCQSGTGRFG